MSKKTNTIGQNQSLINANKKPIRIIEHNDDMVRPNTTNKLLASASVATAANHSTSRFKTKKCFKNCNVSRVLTLAIILIILVGLIWYFFSNEHLEAEENDKRLLSSRLKKLNKTQRIKFYNESMTNTNFDGTKYLDSLLNQSNDNQHMAIDADGSNESNKPFLYLSSNIFIFVCTLAIVAAILLLVVLFSLAPYMKGAFLRHHFSRNSIAFSMFYRDRNRQNLMDFLDKADKADTKAQENLMSVRINQGNDDVNNLKVNEATDNTKKFLNIPKIVIIEND